MFSQTNEIRQLSYEALKAIIKFSSLEKREQLSIRIGGLKNIEALFPYNFEKVDIGRDLFRIRIGSLKRNWHVFPVNSDVPNLPRLEAESKLTHCCVHLLKELEVQRFERKTTSDVPMAKLLKWYLRNETNIDVLFLHGVPPKLSELGKIKLHVKKLYLNRVTQDMLHTWLSIICGKEPPGNQVRFCNNLKIRFFDIQDDSLPLKDCFGNLQNQHVQVEHSRFPIKLLKVVIRKWVEWRRPLGTSFTLGIQHYTTVLDAFDMAAADLKGIPSTFPGVTDFCEHCCTVPIDEWLEVVIFGGRKVKKWPQNFEWELKMEVMRRGTTVPKNQ